MRVTRGLCAVPARRRGALGWLCGMSSEGSDSHSRPCGAAPSGQRPECRAAAACPAWEGCWSRAWERPELSRGCFSVPLCIPAKPYTMLQIFSLWEQRRSRSDGS